MELTAFIRIKHFGPTLDITRFSYQKFRYHSRELAKFVEISTNSQNCGALALHCGHPMQVKRHYKHHIKNTTETAKIR